MHFILTSFLSWNDYPQIRLDLQVLFHRTQLRPSGRTIAYHKINSPVTLKCNDFLWWLCVVLPENVRASSQVSGNIRHTSPLLPPIDYFARGNNLPESLSGTGMINYPVLEENCLNLLSWLCKILVFRTFCFLWCDKRKERKLDLNIFPPRVKKEEAD